jgi:hypothetical protein
MFPLFAHIMPCSVEIALIAGVGLFMTSPVAAIQYFLSFTVFPSRKMPFFSGTSPESKSVDSPDED